ncbi:MAG: hypothetical protein SWK90_03975 [Chloroflexota bacterium]|nr:hypothetical protein [Chloroflexota bacterium]
MKKNNRYIWSDTLAATSLRWDLGLTILNAITGWYNVACATQRETARGQQCV